MIIQFVHAKKKYTWQFIKIIIILLHFLIFIIIKIKIIISRNIF